MNRMSGANVENCIEGVVRLGISRGLVIKSPHIDNILSGHKIWEMRSRRTNMRGKIGLIKSGSGLIVGTAEIVDCLDALDFGERMNTQKNHHVYNLYDLEKWKYPWVLRNAQKLPEPIPYDHPQGAVIWVNL